MHLTQIHHFSFNRRQNLNLPTVRRRRPTCRPFTRTTIRRRHCRRRSVRQRRGRNFSRRKVTKPLTLLSNATPRTQSPSRRTSSSALAPWPDRTTATHRLETCEGTSHCPDDTRRCLTRAEAIGPSQKFDQSQRDQILQRQGRHRWHRHLQIILLPLRLVKSSPSIRNASAITQKSASKVPIVTPKCLHARASSRLIMPNFMRHRKTFKASLSGLKKILRRIETARLTPPTRPQRNVHPSAQTQCRHGRTVRSF